MLRGSTTKTITPADAPLQVRLARLLSPSEAAEALGVTVSTLERWRCNGNGPRFVRASSRVVRYRADDLVGFIEERIVSSTAQA